MGLSMKRTGAQKRKARKKPNAKKIRVFKTMTSLIGLILMCYLQVLLPMSGMPAALQTLLWTGYVAQISILSSRLFGIRMSTLFRVLTIIGNMNLAGMLSKRDLIETGKVDEPK